MKSKTALLVLLVAGLMQAAFAQPYPSKPIKFVTPFAPGGASDQTARLVADGLKDMFGQPVVVEAKIGGSGLVAVDYILKQPADGYLFFVHSQSVGTLPTINPNAKYDPLKDFVAVGTVSLGAMALAVNPELPVNTITEYVNYARANPGKLNHGTAGVGTLDQLGIELLMRSTGVKINVVPYKGGASITADLLGGRLNSQIDSLTTLRSHIEAGKLKGLGVTSTSRIEGFPNMPAIAELVPGYEVATIYGLYAAAGIPREAVSKINAALAEVNKLPSVVNGLKAMGYAPLTSTPEQHAARLKREMDKWIPILKDLNIRI